MFVERIDVTKADELAAIGEQPRTFVILVVNWSVFSLQSEACVSAIADAWQGAEPELAAPLVRIDLSEGEGVIWDAVLNWLQREGQPCHLLMSGTGPLLWVSHGHVLEHVVNPLQASKQSLIERTRALWAAPTNAG
jgi:hypothetical protein